MQLCNADVIVTKAEYMDLSTHQVPLNPQRDRMLSSLEEVKLKSTQVYSEFWNGLKLHVAPELRGSVA